MTGCNTGRNIQKYKGAGASTLQDALENSDTSFLNVNLVSPGLFIGDGGGLSNISAGSTSGNLQSVTNNGATTSNKITFSNGVTSLETSGNALVTGNVTASEFLGDGGTLSNISANKNFQEVTDLGATSSNKITLTNSGTSLETSGNIELGHASDTTIARSSAGVVTIEGNEIRTGIVPFSKGGTGTTSASAAATALGVGTGNSPQFAGIELGHSSDTTLARSSAGVVTIEGNEIRTGIVPVSKGGTGQTSASAAATALGVGTGNSPQFAGIELGHSSDTTLARSSAGVVTIEGNEIRTGIVPVSKGGTGTTTLNNLITMGTHTTGDFVGTITGGNGIASSAGTTGEDTNHTLSIDEKSNGGLVFESNKLAVNLGASSITGTLAVSDGGTGATTLTNLIQLGTHTTGDYVEAVTGGAGISAVSMNSEGGTPHIEVDRKANGGLVIESDKLAVDLGASSITGTLAVSDGGTGTTTLNNLITMGTHTTGDFVGTITGGNGIASSAGTTGEDTNHTLSIDEKSNGGLVFESNKLAVNLGASSITGTLNPGDGGTGHSSYTVGQLLVANGGTSFTKLTPGTSGYFLQSQGAGSALKWESASNIGSATPGQLIMGDYLTGGPHTGATNTTIHVDGTTANTGGKVVVRDSSGDIRVQEVIVGPTGGATSSLTSTAWSGSAAKLTNARNIGGVSFDGTADINLPGVNIGGTQNTSGSAAKLTNARNIGGVSFDGTADINLPGVNIGGTVDTSGKAAKVTITNTDTGNNNRNVLYETGTVNTIGKDAGITYNPYTNILTAAGGFAGVGSALTSLSPGNISGQVPIGKGGTGIAGGYSAGDILYGAGTGTALSKLTPSGSNDVGKFLKLGSGNSPEWDTVSVSTTTIVTTNEESDPNDHGLIFVAGAGTGAQSLLKDSNGTSFGTLKYKPSTGTLKTSNIITTDTSGDARNGIANTAPTHTLDIGSNVSIIDDGIDKLVIRGNCYVINDIVSLGTIHTDILQAKDAFIKNTTVVAERPTRQVRLN